MIETPLMIVGAGLLIGAAMQDLVARTISNGISILLAILGFAVRLGEGSGLLSVFIAAGVFGMGWVCWRFGWLGGGDVKLLAASTLVLPPLAAPLFLLGVSLSGGVLALVFLAARRRVARPADGKPRGFLARALRAERWRLNRGGPLPYAVAIACGALNVIFHEVLPR